MGTFTSLAIGEYRVMCENGAARAIPTMFVPTIEKDENFLPLRTKSQIVVLGNHEECVWSKPQ